MNYVALEKHKNEYNKIRSLKILTIWIYSAFKLIH